jgi:hypothetical protein
VQLRFGDSQPVIGANHILLQPHDERHKVIPNLNRPRIEELDGFWLAIAFSDDFQDACFNRLREQSLFVPPLGQGMRMHEFEFGKALNNSLHSLDNIVKLFRPNPKVTLGIDARRMPSIIRGNANCDQKGFCLKTTIQRTKKSSGTRFLKDPELALISPNEVFGSLSHFSILVVDRLLTEAVTGMRLEFT